MHWYITSRPLAHVKKPYPFLLSLLYYFWAIKFIARELKVMTTFPPQAYLIWYSSVSDITIPSDTLVLAMNKGPIIKLLVFFFSTMSQIWLINY